MIKVFIEKQAGLISLAFPAINEHYDCKSQSEVVDAINDFIGDEPYELIEGTPKPEDYEQQDVNRSIPTLY